MQRLPVESHFKVHDDQTLFYPAWPAVDTPALGAILLFHYGHEHSGRTAHLIDELYRPARALTADAIALVIALMGFLGALVMSAIKRDRGINDCGDMIHGQGGRQCRLFGREPAPITACALRR
jgi:hypothetical protein